MAAASHWAGIRQGTGQNDVQEDMRAMGASEKDIERVQEDMQSDEFSVWPQNIKIVHTFVRCSTQWLRAPMTNQPLGLDYSSVESVLKMLGYWKPAHERVEIFEGIGIMEGEALRILHQRK